MCLHSSLSKNLSEKEDIKPVTSDKDQMFDFKQKKANSTIGSVNPLSTPWKLLDGKGSWCCLGCGFVATDFLGEHVSYRLFLSVFPAFAKQSASAACRKGCDSKLKLA